MPTAPRPSARPADTYTHYGYLLSQITIDPAQAQKIVDTVLAIAADLQKNGATPDELERAKKPILTALRESARTNPYWPQQCRWFLPGVSAAARLVPHALQ